MLDAHHFLYFAMLLPAFVWGWQQGKKVKFKEGFQTTVDFMLMIGLNILKKKLVERLVI
jgi:hypothetical protein